MSLGSYITASKLIGKIAELQAKLTRVQAECDHAVSVYEAEGSTGNWDREDSYWFACYCYDCERRWVVDQSAAPPCRLRVQRINVFEKRDRIALLIKAEEVK